MLRRDLDVPVVPYNAVALGSVCVATLLVRSPAHPATLDLMSVIGARGGRPMFVDDGDDRQLSLDESPSSTASFETLDIAQAVRTLSSAPPSVASVQNEARRAGADFALLLPAEETPLDTAGHHWLQSMRNSRRGETVVLIGNGPSLNETDLELLAGVDTFGVNSIFLADDRFVEPLTYFVVEDTAVFNDNEPEIKRYEATHKLFPTLYQPRFTDDEITENTHFFRMNMGFYGRHHKHAGPTRTVCHPRFSMDASQRVYCGQSVTIINLQLAHWFGYQRVVLIGMDFSYTIPDDADRTGNLIVSNSDDPNHFHPGYFGAGKTWKDPKLDRVLVNYRLANEAYQASGREIINSTVGGRLEVFRRLPLEAALADHSALSLTPRSGTSG